MVRSASLRAAACALALVLGACEAERAAQRDAVGAPAPSLEPDLERGELLSLACQACHTLDSGGADSVGPNLHGVFGRTAASRERFSYSAALRESDLVWTPEAVAAWLADPAGFLPGNTMTFTGYQSERDRRDLVAFLLAATGGAPPD